MYAEGQPFLGKKKSLRKLTEFLSENVDLPMVIRIGHYYFDNKPLIGKMVDVNVWSRYLSSRELERFSNCSLHTEKFGDLINETSEFTVTGNLTTRISVPASECECGKKQSRRTVNVHIPFLTFDLAKMTCDKYFMNSIVGPFDDFADWEDFYSIGNRNPAVARHCDTGGRRLHCTMV